jgi:CheY-like chemotaxis protein
MKPVFTPTILIVEDHEDGRDMLVEYFLAHGYRAIAVGDPRIAVTLCRDTEPAIVFVDLSLPTLDAACELIRTIKHGEGGVPPYIVGLNGWGFVQHATPALAAGCSLVIAKPLDLHLLTAAVTIGMAANLGGCSAA